MNGPKFKAGETTSARKLNAIVSRLPRPIRGSGIVQSRGAMGTLGLPRQLGNPRSVFRAIITSSEPVGSRSWRYTFQEVVKAYNGYGGWIIKTDGRQGQAYNYYEDKNEGDVIGTNVAVANIPEGWEVRPIAVGLIVDLEVVPVVRVTGPGDVVTGDVEFWMREPNSIDGTCDGEGEPDPCDGVFCPPGFICVDGECVEQGIGEPGPCDGVECPPGESCVDGVCVPDDPPDPCEGIQCPPEQGCVDGICLGCGNGGAPCQAGFYCWRTGPDDPGECLPLPPSCVDDEDCPDGFACMGGICVEMVPS